MPQDPKCSRILENQMQCQRKPMYHNPKDDMHLNDLCGVCFALLGNPQEYQNMFAAKDKGKG